MHGGAERLEARGHARPPEAALGNERIDVERLEPIARKRTLEASFTLRAGAFARRANADPKARVRRVA